MQTLQQVENYTALSERASEYLLAVIRSKPDAVICPATGATPLLTYHYLVEKIHQQQVDVSQLTFVKLDEMGGSAINDARYLRNFPATAYRAAAGYVKTSSSAFAPKR